MLKKALVGALEVLEKPLVTRWKSVGKAFEKCWNLPVERKSVSVRFPVRGHIYPVMEKPDGFPMDVRQTMFLFLQYNKIVQKHPLLGNLRMTALSLERMIVILKEGAH